MYGRGGGGGAGEIFLAFENSPLTVIEKKQ